MNGPGRVTYLMPIESTNRELDYKLVLASMLKAPHRQFVFFRPDLGTALSRLVQGGIWIGQNIRARTPQGDDYGRYRQLKASGCAVVYVDEEGAIYPGDEAMWAEHLRARLDATQLADDDLLVGWGAFHERVWRTLSPLRAQIVTSGHPRFDLCSDAFAPMYEQEVQRIRAKHGEFVLINTNFATANYVRGLGGLFNPIDGYQPADVERRLTFVGNWQRALTSLGEFVMMVHRLAARLPHVKFVLRPHPVEDHDVYHQTLAGVANIAVAHEGSAVPWLRAATAVIHNGCTTAIEAYLAGTQPIAYCPPSIGDGESWVPNAFSVRTESFDELERAVAAVVAQPRGHDAAQASDARHVVRERAATLMRQLGTGAVRDGSFAAVVNAIEGVEERVVVRGASLRERIAKVIAEAHGAGARTKATARRLQSLAQRSPDIQPKFHSFSNDTLQEKCDRIARVAGNKLELDLWSSTACVLR
jgi:surface carbohydrate biosynthesis protein